MSKILFFVLISLSLFMNFLAGQSRSVVVNVSMDLAGHYDIESRTLNLNNLGYTEDTLRLLISDIFNFINLNKVEILLLENNAFQSLHVVLKQISCLLTGCATLKSVSLKNNFKQPGCESVPNRSIVSQAALSQIISALPELATLIKDSLAGISQQTNIEYVVKYIYLDDMPPFSFITETKIPLTVCQRFKPAMLKLGIGVVSMVVSAGITILTVYLTGKMGQGSC